MQRPTALLLTLLLTACAAPMASRHSSGPVTVGVLAINDFHGNLEPPKQPVAVPDGRGGTIPVPAGGAAWLASTIDSLRANYAGSVTVSAGDLISASPIASSLFLDEPTIGVMNRIGLEFNAVGNHEFDRGREELLRMQNGGCVQHTARRPCSLEGFEGAGFRFLSASTTTEDGRTLFPATGLRRFGKGKREVAVGFIGLTLKGTPELVSPDGVRGLAFGDEAEAINAAVPRLRAQGADAVVVLIHQGGKTAPGSDPSGCTDLTGNIRPILDRLAPGVDVVVSGHTHQAYVCDYGPVLLTSAGNYGQLVTDITLEIDPRAGRVTAKRARNVIVRSQPNAAGAESGGESISRFVPRGDIQAYVGRYVDAAREYAQRPVGRLSGPATKSAVGTVDMGGPLGNLIADAQLAATAGAGAQIALTNPFGIRAPLTPAADGSVTFGMIYAVQPFDNRLVTQTMTGAELKALLEQSFADSGTEQFLSPSAGFTYTVDRSGAAGQRVRAMTLHGTPIDPAASYRVTTNSFLANGGDGFTELTRQRGKVLGDSDLDALQAWLQAAPLRAVPAETRVRETVP